MVYFSYQAQTELNWAPKMEVYVGDKYELEKFRSTVSNKNELEARLYFVNQKINTLFI